MFRYLLNILLVLSFLVLLLTGIFKFPELQIAWGLYNYPLPWRVISLIHDWSGAVLGILIVIHLWLNRRWFVQRTIMIFAKKK